jgi:hypothetical protein
MPGGGSEAECQPAGGWSILLLVYCVCGWRTTQTEAGIVYCSNARCPRRGTAYVFSVFSREINYSDRLDSVQ